MTKSFKAFLSIFLFIIQNAGAQNWAPVNCFNADFPVSNMFVDSLHDEIILNFSNTHSVCGIYFKGCLAYNQNGFHTLDFGIDTHNSNPNTGGDKIIGTIPYNGKSLMYGYFASVGTNTLPAEALALWDGNHWSNIPKYAFKYDPNRNNIQAVYGMYKDNGKLWIYGQFDSIGGVKSKNIVSFDGVNYTGVNFPANNFYSINKMIRYKNELIVSGLFYNQPNNGVSQIARFDGTNWLAMGNGVQGSLDGIWEMVIYKDTLYMAGSMNNANNPGTHIMKWDGTNFHDGGFGNYYSPESINQLVVYKNKLYAFGNFLHAANQKAFRVAYYENGKWTVPQDSVDNTISSAVVYHDELYIAGGFWSINGDQNIQFFSKLRCPDFDAASGCISGINKHSKNDLNFSVFPNPTKYKLQIKSNNSSIIIESVSIVNSLGQEIFNTSNYATDNEIDLSKFSNGLYYLLIKTNQGYSRQKIQKE